MDLTQEQKFKFRLRLEKEQEASSPEKNNQQESSPGFISTLEKSLSNPIQSIGPMGIPAMAMEYAKKGIDVPGTNLHIPGSTEIGQRGSEILQEKGIHPALAKSLGFLSSYGPDIVQMAVPGEAEIKAMTETGELPKGFLASTARKYAAKALGATKRFLNSEKKVEDIEKASQILLEQDAIPAFGSTNKIRSNISRLAETSGKKIGEILHSSEVKLDPTGIASEMQNLRPEATGGYWDSFHGKINRAIKTILGFGKNNVSYAGERVLPQLTAEQANQTKSLLQDVAYKEGGTLLDRVIAGKYREWLDKSLEEAASRIKDPEKFKEFMKAKRVYAATQIAEDPIYNRLSSELGNKGISLTDWISTIPAEIALGSPEKALIFLLGKKGIERYGPQIGANIAKGLTTVNPAIVPQAINSLGLNSDQNK